MGKQINSPQEFAFELRDFISYNALSGKELKSIAGSINYPLGMFKAGKRVLLTNELVFLHSYLGEVMIKHCFENLTEASLGKANHIAEIYRKNLISQWVPDSMFQDYERRLHVWDGLLLNFESGKQYQNDLSKLVITFYEFLTNKPCSEHNELMLTVRFHEYVKILITSIEAMVQDTAFDDKQRRFSGFLLEPSWFGKHMDPYRGQRFSRFRRQERASFAQNFARAERVRIRRDASGLTGRSALLPGCAESAPPCFRIGQPVIPSAKPRTP